jgi:hypothetical protein
MGIVAIHFVQGLLYLVRTIWNMGIVAFHFVQGLLYPVRTAWNKCREEQLKSQQLTKDIEQQKKDIEQQKKEEQEKDREQLKKNTERLKQIMIEDTKDKCVYSFNSQLLGIVNDFLENYKHTKETNTETNAETTKKLYVNASQMLINHRKAFKVCNVLEKNEIIPIDVFEKEINSALSMIKGT